MRSSSSSSSFSSEALVILAVLVTASPACSSSDDAPAPFSNRSPDEAAERDSLRALEIDPDSEPVADEDGGPGVPGGASDGANADGTSSGEEATAPLDEFGEPIIAVPPEGLLDNPLFDDEEDEPQIETLSVNPLVSPGQLGDSTKTSALVHGPWKCRLAGKQIDGCACKGSPLNCQVPNAQPGRNRYLPPAFASEMDKRVSALRAQGKPASSPVDGGKWNVTPSTRVYDGAGKLRGRLASPGELPEDPTKPKNICLTWADPTSLALVAAPGECVKINFGGKKRLKPDGGAEATYVYAFNALIALSSPTGLDVSGWIPLSAIPQPEQDTLVKMPTAGGRRITQGSSFVATSYVLKSAVDWQQTPSTFSTNKLPAYALSKVAPGPAASKKVGDYLLKDGNVWNLAYNTPGVGGVGTDTFIVDHQKLGFRRVRSTAARATLIRVKVYGNPAKRSMIFAYGSVAGRFGWVALDAIKTGAVTTSSTGAGADFNGYCTGKADGTYCNETTSILGYICRGGEIAKALQCASPNTVCDGPSPDGMSLVCHE